MVTLIRLHVDGYISFLMYGDNSQCLVSYCKQTKVCKINMRNGEDSCNLTYGKNHNMSTGGYRYTIEAFLFNGMNPFDDALDSNYITYHDLCDAIDSHYERRVIKSLVKPYSKVSSFNPKNRRVISAK
jgi:hypothetical protein